jgi:hypothetical protein
LCVLVQRLVALTILNTAGREMPQAQIALTTCLAVATSHERRDIRRLLHDFGMEAGIFGSPMYLLSNQMNTDCESRCLHYDETVRCEGDCPDRVKHRKLPFLSHSSGWYPNKRLDVKNVDANLGAMIERRMTQTIHLFGGVHGQSKCPHVVKISINFATIRIPVVITVLYEAVAGPDPERNIQRALTIFGMKYELFCSHYYSKDHFITKFWYGGRMYVWNSLSQNAKPVLDGSTPEGYKLTSLSYCYKEGTQSKPVDIAGFPVRFDSNCSADVLDLCEETKVELNPNELLCLLNQVEEFRLNYDEQKSSTTATSTTTSTTTIPVEKQKLSVVPVPNEPPGTQSQTTKTTFTTLFLCLSHSVTTSNPHVYYLAPCKKYHTKLHGHSILVRR